MGELLGIPLKEVCKILIICHQITLELGCDKYPPASALSQEWEDNRKSLLEFIWLAHSGVKGVVKDFDTRKGIANAIIHVKNITRVAKTFRRSDDIDHDITSVHDGDYWRLLTPGEYEIIAVADGYEPMAKLVEVTDNGHDTAPVVNFELRKIEDEENVNPEEPRMTNMDYPSNSDYLEPLVDEDTLQNLYPMY